MDDLQTRFLNKLEDGCANCEVDPAHSEITHCEECQKRLTEWAYELIVIRMDWPELYAKRMITSKGGVTE